MKFKSFILSLIFLSVVSCKQEPTPPYVYESNPNYTYMRLSYYGQYYLSEGIDSHVFSLTFYSEGMVNEDSTAVESPGQELYIEDLFIPEDNFNNINLAENDSVLTEAQVLALLKGDYKASGDSKSETFGDTFTFAPGEYMKVDSITYILGARITYYEEDDAYSKRVLLPDGSFTVDESGLKFDFLTEKAQQLTGSYQSASAMNPKFQLKVKRR